MTFHERLNEYMRDLSCNGKELSLYAGLSEAVISRYRKGEREPGVNSEQLQKIAKGIAAVSKKKNENVLSEESVMEDLKETILAEKDIFFYERLNILIDELQINVSRMAAFLHYDASYISKVRTGKRKPSNQDLFIKDVCRYITSQFSGEEGKRQVASVINTDVSLLGNEISYLEQLGKWLSSGRVKKIDYVSGFLRKMDAFDLNDYIRAIHFDTLKVPKVPFLLPVSKHYYGLKEMRDGELDFLKHVVLSKSMEPLCICSDMPVEDMAADEDFAKKYMFGLAMVLKKGLHIHIIHNVERPMKEMMLGLENWIPMYMTGQVSPYYIKGVQNQVYSHLHYCSGTAAMNGDCISGHHDRGHYYFTTNKEEVDFYGKNMKYLLKKASPLMEIYREEEKAKLEMFLEEEADNKGRRHRILAAPPLFAIKEERLASILECGSVSEEEKKEIMSFYRREKKRILKILEHSTIHDEIMNIDAEEYEEHPLSLSLAGCFLEKDILLTFDEYQECLEDTKQFESKHLNYEFSLEHTEGFRNISIANFDGKWSMVSKNRAPSIHFVIFHPTLRNALEHIVLPVKDEENTRGKGESI